MRKWKIAMAALLTSFATVPATAEMVLSQVIFDLHPGKPPREDVEVFNTSGERMYVAADAFEIVHPGTEAEVRLPADRPDLAGILVSPKRLILAPGERRTIRIAMLGPRSAKDRVYRVAIKPVVGAVTSDKNALSVFVGYDTLVIVRPEILEDKITYKREGQTLSITNEGNTSQEFFEGRQCDAVGKVCAELPAKRLYAGATWTQELPLQSKATYKTAIAEVVKQMEF